MTDARLTIYPPGTTPPRTTETPDDRVRRSLAAAEWALIASRDSVAAVVAGRPGVAVIIGLDCMAAAMSGATPPHCRHGWHVRRRRGATP